MLVRGLLSTLLYTPRRLNITAAVMLTPLVADVSLVIHLSIWRVIAAVPLASPVYFKGGCSLCCFSDLSPGLVFRQRLVSRPAFERARSPRACPGQDSQTTAYNCVTLTWRVIWRDVHRETTYPDLLSQGASIVLKRLSSATAYHSLSQATAATQRV
eukprot:413575-Pyramimonas_sp.AAC.1